LCSCNQDTEVLVKSEAAKYSCKSRDLFLLDVLKDCKFFDE
jgi:hypothetical protein